MNKEKGIVGIAVLWILTALSSMALAALAVGQAQMNRGRSHLEETRVLTLAQASFLLAEETDFKIIGPQSKFETGFFTTEKQEQRLDGLTRIRCEVTSGRMKQKFETGWRRIQGTWRAVYWRECI